MMQNSSYKKGEFTYKQDLRLKRCVKEDGMHNWDKVAQKMKHFTAQECEARYNHIINGDLVKRPWTLEEDKLLIQKINECGKKWSIICMALKGRSETAAKNRWRLLERRNFAMNGTKPRNQKPKLEPIANQIPPQPKRVQLPMLPSFQIPLCAHQKELDKLFSSLAFVPQQTTKIPSLIPNTILHLC